MADETDKPRDAEGRFVNENVDPAETVKTTFETTGPVNVITKPAKDNFDEPLVSVKIQNPFKKILSWLNDIRKKQTTTFAFKISIPLLALPIFFAVLGGAFQFFFNLGQAKEQQAVAAMPTPTPIIIVQPTLTPAPVLTSRMGTIKATYQVQNLVATKSPDKIATSPLAPRDDTNFVIASDSAEETKQSPTIEPSATPTPIPARYVLVKGEDVTFLIVPTEVSLSYYLNKRVLITGLYNKTTDTLHIAKTQDIEILQ